MSMIQVIRDNQLQARKNRDAIATALLTTIIGEFQRGKVKGDPTDKQVFDSLVVMKNTIEENQVKSSVTEQSTRELEVLAGLLALKPAATSPEEIEGAVSAILAANNAANFGMIMGQLKKQFGDQLNGGEAKVIVETLLANR